MVSINWDNVISQTSDSKKYHKSELKWLHERSLRKNLNAFLKIKSLLANKEVFPGKKFIIKDEKLKSFMIKRFKDSNNLVENEFNISINQFLD